MVTDNGIDMVVKDKTIIQQAARIKVKYPQYKVTTTTSSIVITGSLQPTARSVMYDFRIEYHLYQLPIITIAEGQLVRNAKDENIPHMYEQKSLCLFRPKYRQFTMATLIGDTIIPWTSLWLFHYESWHITGKWHGGGEHPIRGRN
ncbi:MAG: hypothetical protein ABI480_01785 [Chitinophagaceae bacterium]